MTEKAHARNREFTINEVHEIFSQLNITEPTATDYAPEFMEGVLVLGPEETWADVSPNYCLRIPSCFGLMCILADLGPVAYLDDPQKFSSGSTFYYSNRVPWLKFADGTIRNAGQLAICWQANNGDPGGKTAEANCRMDIAWGN